MSQENDAEKMRPEYDIRGGVRGKYFRRYMESRLHPDESPWISVPATGSTGEHARESTIQVVVEPLYQAPRMEVSVSVGQ